MIEKQHHQTGFLTSNDKAKLVGEHLATVRYAVEVYCFLLAGLGQFSYQDLADKIREGYSMDNPRNEAVVNALELANAMFQQD